MEDLQDRFRVVRRVALQYRGGADASVDRPAHVRAASGLCWWGGRLAVVSDDASFIGVIDPATGLTDPITLPHAPGDRRQFDTGRGNKADKLDLECVIAIDDMLVAFGSDSGLAVRRQAVVIDRPGAEPRVVALPRLYAALQSPALGTGCLNIEGAAVHEQTIVLGNRGGDVGDDGAPTRDAVIQLDATALLGLLQDPERAPLPRCEWTPLAIVPLRGQPLRLTELTAVGGRLMFAATAEATTTAYDDGVVTGSVIGTIAGPMERYRTDWHRVVDEHGNPLVAKIEGMVEANKQWRFLIVIDADDPARPSELLEVALGD